MTTSNILSIILIAVTAIAAATVIIHMLINRKNRRLNGYEIIKTEIAENIKSSVDAVDKTVRDSNDIVIKMLFNSTTSMESKINTQLGEIRDSIANTLAQLNRDNALNNNEMRELLDSKIRGIQYDIVNTLTQLNKDSAVNNKEMRELLDNKIQGIQNEVDKKLDKIMADNNAKLDDMRKIVDEKLQETLSARIAESFKIINDQMSTLNKNIGEVQSLSTNVVSLNRIMSGVKTRGMWGEVSLETLLDEILTPEQYQAQATISGQNKVDFAVKMPGRGDGTLLLPIDVKFPLDLYEHICAASDVFDKKSVEIARKALFAEIERLARDIRDKYIKPPKTTDFAIMYLPTEGLYAEVIKEPGLCSAIQSKHRIIICGPTTITALLNSLQIGFKTLTIQKSSAEIFKALNSFKRDFGKFDDILNKTREKAESIIKNMDDGIKRTSIISGNLAKLEKYQPEQIEEVANEK